VISILADLDKFVNDGQVIDTVRPSFAQTKEVPGILQNGRLAGRPEILCIENFQAPEIFPALCKKLESVGAFQ